MWTVRSTSVRRRVSGLKCFLDIPYGPTVGADPRRVVVAGHSAGGHGVVMVLATRWAENYGIDPSVVKGGCAITESIVDRFDRR